MTNSIGSANLAEASEASDGSYFLDHIVQPYLDRTRARPFVKWAGGKRNVIPEIAKRLPRQLDGTYWEPFVGGGAVFFALEGLVASAQLSDVNSELALTYQVVKNDPEALIELLETHAVRHNQTYYLRVRQETGRPSAVEVAARLIYLNKTCYNGLYRVNKNGRFNVPMGSYKNPTICDADALREASEVLQKATIRIGDFGKIEPYDGDFVYADPPMMGRSRGMIQMDLMKLPNSGCGMRLCAGTIKGRRVMLSNADSPLIRNLYGRPPFRLHEISALRSINSDGKGRGAVGELLITSYE